MSWQQVREMCWDLIAVPCVVVKLQTRRAVLRWAGLCRAAPVCLGLVSSRLLSDDADDADGRRRTKKEEGEMEKHKYTKKDRCACVDARSGISLCCSIDARSDAEPAHHTLEQSTQPQLAPPTGFQGP